MTTTSDEILSPFDYRRYLLVTVIVACPFLFSASLFFYRAILLVLFPPTLIPEVGVETVTLSQILAHPAFQPMFLALAGMLIGSTLLVFYKYLYLPKNVKTFLETETQVLNTMKTSFQGGRRFIFEFAQNQQTPVPSFGGSIGTTINLLEKENPLRFTIQFGCPLEDFECRSLATNFGYRYSPSSRMLISSCQLEELKWRIWQLLLLSSEITTNLTQA